MRPLGRDSPRPSLREVPPASRLWGPPPRRRIGVLVAALTTLGWVGTVLAAGALWQLVTTLDWLVTAAEKAGATATESTDPVDLDAVRPRFVQSSVSPPPPIAQGLVVSRATTRYPGRAIEEHAERPTPLALPPAPEFHGAICRGVFVYIVTLVENAPSRSAVSFASSETARANFAHPGERIDGWELLAITDDWTGANPVVWLLREEEEVCRTGLTGNPARLQAILQQEKHERQARRARHRRRRRH